MRTIVLGALLVLAGGCRDRDPAGKHARPAPAAALRAIPKPAVAAAGEIDNLDIAPPTATDRLVILVQAIEHDRKDAFLEAVSTGGLAVGQLALNAEQVQAELAGRTVAELMELPCTGGCRWRIARVEPTRMELEARDDHGPIGAITLMHEDDDSWGVLSARRL